MTLLVTKIQGKKKTRKKRTMWKTSQGCRIGAQAAIVQLSHSTNEIIRQSSSCATTNNVLSHCSTVFLLRKGEG